MITFDEAQILGWLSALLMPLFRLLGLFSSAPLLSSRNIPVRWLHRWCTARPLPSMIRPSSC